MSIPIACQDGSELISKYFELQILDSSLPWSINYKNPLLQFHKSVYKYNVALSYQRNCSLRKHENICETMTRPKGRWQQMHFFCQWFNSRSDSILDFILLYVWACGIIVWKIRVFTHIRQQHHHEVQDGWRWPYIVMTQNNIYIID